MTTLVNPCPTLTPVVSGDLQRHLSSAARRTAFRYLSLAQARAAGDAVLLAFGTMAVGASTLLKHLQEETGMAQTTGAEMLARTAEELRRLSQVPGDHSQALTALGVELLNMATKEEGHSHD
ncbi:MAG: hypothetical protein KA204_04950 [Chromatiaceae bacterium]|nr:hypothetical protein [Chromatiaceae bacterium]MBP6733507.1 hypothetical protein [Chromatiaceae bacterium]MBP6806933.1 hypothetical protein [Chromatiaceae bacterium]MBP8283094.1 hypothetical protein [Chromatiaceae bacterium]MBP8288433.1 hypothetical protein [Chromatiaceae bacterium]